MTTDRTQATSTRSLLAGGYRGATIGSFALVFLAAFEALEAAGTVPAAATEAENRLGSFLGAMGQAANDSPDVTPRTGDRATARSLGVRVARAAARWRAGGAQAA